MREGRRYTVRIHDERESGEGLWAEVVELPGCFASGDDFDELRSAVVEAIGLVEDHPVRSAQWSHTVEHQLLIDA